MKLYAAKTGERLAYNHICLIAWTFSSLCNRGNMSFYYIYISRDQYLIIFSFSFLFRILDTGYWILDTGGINFVKIGFKQYPVSSIQYPVSEKEKKNKFFIRYWFTFL